MPQAKKHYTNVLRDMLGTLDRHLGENEYLAGDYSVADVSIFADVHRHGVDDIGLDEYPNLRRWHDAIWRAPAPSADGTVRVAQGPQTDGGARTALQSRLR